MTHRGANREIGDFALARVAHCRTGMAIDGVITSKEIFRNTWTIVCEFGPRAYLRCCTAMFTGRRTTFLACVFAI